MSALSRLNSMMISEEPPSVEEIQDSLWAGKASHIAFQLHAEVEETQALYELELKADTDNPFAAEELSVGDVQVISIQERGGYSSG